MFGSDPRSSRGDLVARAQRASIPLIGFLGVRPPEFDAAMLAEFRRGMNEKGYVEGTNVAIEFRWAAGQFDRLPALADDLVRQRVDLLVTSGGTASARQAAHCLAWNAPGW
jgi:putative ABC transport system substrate-binding protein